MTKQEADALIEQERERAVKLCLQSADSPESVEAQIDFLVKRVCEIKDLVDQ